MSQSLSQGLLHFCSLRWRKMLEHLLNWIESGDGKGRVGLYLYTRVFNPHSLSAKGQKYKNICLCPLRVLESRRGSESMLNNNTADYFMSAFLCLCPWQYSEHYGLSSTSRYSRSQISTVGIIILLPSCPGRISHWSPNTLNQIHNLERHIACWGGHEAEWRTGTSTLWLTASFPWSKLPNLSGAPPCSSVGWARCLRYCLPHGSKCDAAR